MPHEKQSSCAVARITNATTTALAASPPLHQRFPNIEGIRFGITFEKTAVLSEAAFKAFFMSDARHMARLRSVCLQNCWGIELHSIAVLVEHCPALESLRLPFGTETWPDSNFGVLASLPRLSVLSVYAVPCNNASLADLAKLTGLREFSWTASSDNNGPNMLTLPPTLTKLTQLALLIGYHRDDNVGTAQYGTMGCLRSLSNFCVYQVDHTIGKLADCTALSDISCASIEMTFGEGLPVVALPSGTRLEFSGVIRGCIGRCVRMFHNLASFTCWELVDEQLALVGASAPRLRRLCMWRSRCTNTGLQECMSRLTALERLELIAPETLIDDDHFGLVNAGLTSLRHLELTDCVHLGKFAGTLLARLVGLNEVALIDCPKVNVACISALVVNVPSLQGVVIEGCGTRRGRLGALPAPRGCRGKERAYRML